MIHHQLFPTRPSGAVAGLCLALLSALASHGFSQVVIEYVGTEVGTEASGYSVQNWSNPGVPKAYDVGGSEVYGSGGYCQIRPLAWPEPDPSININTPALEGNDLGVTEEPDPSFYAPPDWLASIAGGAGSYVNYSGYSIYRGPDGQSLYRQGALSVPVSQGPYDSPAGGDASYLGVPLQFTVATAAKFRLGIAVDSVGDGAYAPDYVNVYHTGTGTSVFSAVLDRDGVADLVLFDITAEAGDSFVVGLWQNSGTQNVAALSLLTVDLLTGSVPELSYTVADGNFILSWPPATVGWTLEGTMNLELQGSWTAVPGVVDNSVAVPMTVPKQFFRLRENP
jgi:hypothetical protein